MKKNYAYITMATSPDYLLGLMTMWLSLKNTGTLIPLYAMLPHELVLSNPEYVNRLKKSGISILEYNNSIQIPQQLIDNNAHNGFLRFNHTFDKLLVFELTQFDKIVYIDADMYILHNLNHLFAFSHMSAVAAGRSYPGNQDWVDLNSGLMVIQPQQDIVQELAQKNT